MGDGVEAHRLKIIKYMELSEDESKRQMALSASACEQFEAGSITSEEYLGLLDRALSSTVEAQAFNGEDFGAWLDRFESVLKAHVGGAAPQDDLTKLLSRVEQRIDALQAREDEIAAKGEVARQDPSVAEGTARRMRDQRDVSERMLLAQAPEAIQFQWDTSASLARVEGRLDGLAGRLRSLEGRAGQTDSRPAVGGVIRSTKVFFAVGRSEVETPFAAELVTLVSNIRLERTQGAQISAIVVGYADETGRLESNRQLAAARAEAVAEILRRLGVSDISIVSNGPTKAFGSSLQMNRVVVVEISSSP